MKIGDKVLILPDLTLLKDWREGIAIDIEKNSFIGTVISVKTSDGNIFFGKEDMFKLQIGQDVHYYNSIIIL